MSVRNFPTADWEKWVSSPVGCNIQVLWDAIIPLDVRLSLDGTYVGTLVGRWGKVTVDGWCGNMTSLIQVVSEGLSKVLHHLLLN